MATDHMRTGSEFYNPASIVAASDFYSSHLQGGK